MTGAEILSRLLAQISDEFDKSVGSFFYDSQAPLSIVLEEVYERLESILENGFARTATGNYLDNKVAEQGLARKDGTFAIGTVTITGDIGAVINIGDKVSAGSVTFAVTEKQTLTENGATVAVRCDSEGAIGNVPVGAINKFPVTLPRLTSVTNPQPTTGGYDEEGDDELRLRYFEKVSAPATSGNKYHYIQWAKEVTGVGDARVIPLWDGPGTVLVLILNSGKMPADADLIKTVALHIEEVRPIGANVKVQSVVPVYINISVTVCKKDGAVDVEKEVEAAVEDYLKNIAFTSTFVSIAHIGGTILACGNITDYRELKANGGNVNIPIENTQVAVLGEVVISEAY